MHNRLLLNYLTTSAWALHEPTLRNLAAIVARHAAGVRLNAQERAAIKGRRSAAKPRASSGSAGGGESLAYVDDGICVVSVDGIIAPHSGTVDDISEPAGTDPASIERSLLWAAEDPNVHAILLAFNSPGGSVERIAAISDLIYALADDKPIIAQCDELCCSAAYWMASQTQAVYLNETGVLGSIGVYTVAADQSRLFSEGLLTDVHVIGSGGHKGDFEPGTEITEDQLAEAQRFVDATADVFIAHVARGLQISKAAARKLADGRVHVGRDAVAGGLADGVQSFEKTLELMKAEYRHGPPVQRAKPAASAGAEPSSSLTSQAENQSMNSTVDRTQTIKSFNAAVQQHRRRGLSRRDAIKAVGRTDPELYRAFIVASQPIESQHQAARKAYSPKP